MKTEKEKRYIDTLKKELVPALGCTEPIAVAYASARAAQVLGEFPEHINISCSGNIIKNVKGVKVPNAGGLKGVGAAAVLGVVGGNADLELEVLEDVKPAQIERTKRLLEQGFFSCRLLENVENLHIVATVTAGAHSASVTIINRHTLITEIAKDGEILYKADCIGDSSTEKEAWDFTVKDILEFAKTVSPEKIEPILEPQIRLNTAIAEIGFAEKYGVQVGQTLLTCLDNNVYVRARARAAAGSDARMGGCSAPVRQSPIWQAEAMNRFAVQLPIPSGV